MPSSGIEVSDELNIQWNGLRQDNNINYIILGIENMEKFVITKSGNAADPAQQAQQLLEDKEPAYVLVRGASGKFYIIFYCPLGAKNALKMVYSSSLNALKSGLGTDNLISEVYATSKAEVSQNSLDQSTLQIDRFKLMTQQEQLAHDAAYSSVGNMETESKMTADLPVQISSAAQGALDALKNGSANAVAFTLNTTSEELEVLTQGNLTPEQMQSKLDNKVPSFVFFKYQHQNPETQASATNCIFIYYCPHSAPVKSKMFHSSSKAPVMRIFEMNGCKRDAGFEADNVNEITTEHIMRVLYPPSQQVTRVAKPLPPHLRRKQGGASPTSE